MTMFSIETLFYHFELKVMAFIDENGNEVLQLGSIVKLAERTIRNIFKRSATNICIFFKLSRSYPLDFKDGDSY